MNQSSTQRVRELMGQATEQLVAVNLALRCQGTQWHVRQAILEPGCDIVLEHGTTGQRINVEVKSRQRIMTRQDSKGSVLYQVSAGEGKHMHVMVAHFFDDGSFYIVPKDHMDRSKDGKVYDWTLSRHSATGEPHDRMSAYRDAWHLVHRDLGRSGT